MIKTMDKQDKELLLKDLCARLQYGFKYQVQYGDTSVRDVKKFILDDEYSLFDAWMVHEIKPYLRPMSSMTEEEDKDWQFYKSRIVESCDELLEKRIAKLHDWFCKKYLDYRGLIPMNLALPAPEGMYNF